MTKDIKTLIRYTGIQPQYFPRLHYFARILNTDIFIIRDDCQYLSDHKYPDGTRDKSYQSHTPIKVPQGRYLLSIPIRHAGFQPLFSTKIQYDSWNTKQLKSLQINYGRSKNFSLLFPEITQVLNKQYESMAALNIATICWGILTILGEDVSSENLNLEYVREKLAQNNSFRFKEIRLGSSLKSLADPGLSANEKIIAMIKEVGANEDYCGGTGIAAYIDHQLFEKNKIKITVQDWKGKEYSQQHAKLGFIPNLSILDLLMNVDRQEAVKILIG